MAPSKKFNNKKVRPFIINKVLGSVIYKLKLLLSIGIYPVFYQSLLEPIINKETGRGGYWKFEQEKPQEFRVEKNIKEAGSAISSKIEGIPIFRKYLGTSYKLDKLLAKNSIV